MTRISVRNGKKLDLDSSKDHFKKLSQQELEQEESKLLEKISQVRSQLKVMHLNNNKNISLNNSRSESSRLIMVSNRLPITLEKEENGKWKYELSSGGLVTALAGLKQDLPFIWIGWIGIDVPAADQLIIKKELISKYNYYPIFLDSEMAESYYNGFCNDILWPLFHYSSFPSTFLEALSAENSRWISYKKANDIFAKSISEVYEPEDLVWIHDYHLMLVPEIIRKSQPYAKIGWFLHTPFPAFDFFRMLPMRAELIKGVVAADLAGFHTLEYSDHFFSSCTQILKAESDEKQRKMLLSGHQCKFGVFPIGIDVAKIESTLKLESVQNRIKELEEKFKGKKVLLGIDRLDYIKGMPHRLLAFESFLKRFPTWRDKVALVQIAVPSRTSVPKYQKLCTQVNELVGKINGNFGSISSFPIHYLFQSVPLEELCALYAIADVCIVSSVRDGMNLVSHEYVVCQQKRNGVLILSEFAGAAKTLPKSSKINPWDIEHFADEIHKALKLDIEERRRKQKALYQYVSTNTASFWGKSFVNSLMKNIDREEEESRMSDFHSEQKEEETQ